MCDNNSYKCPLCIKTFKTFSLMSKHKNKHLKKPHQCEKCPETYNILDNLLLHNVTHSKELIKCPKCDKYFNRLSSLRGHIKIHFKNEYYTCVHCEEAFLHESLLAEHISNVHTGNKTNTADPAKRHKDGKRRNKHICEFCNKVFTKPCLLERHVRIHNNTRPFKCEICNKAFHQLATLQMHERTHSGTKPHKCPQCFQGFAQKGNLNIHMKRVHSSVDNTDKQYPCSYCTCVFGQLGSLNRHISQYHPNYKQQLNMQESDVFHYDIKQVISQLQQLQTPDFGSNHDDVSKVTSMPEQSPMQQQHDDKIEEYPSDSMAEGKQSPAKCFIKMADRLTNGKIIFRTVEQRIINNTRVFICEYCSKVMKRPSDFLRHLRVHTKEKPFECTVCHRHFAIKSTLNTHMRTHDVESKTNKVNSSCRLYFKSMDDLNAHMQNNGSNKCLFHCTDCTETFPSDVELAEHRKQHESQIEEPTTPRKKSKRKLFTGADIQRPFACNICHASFRRKDDLNSHIASHKNRRTFKCKLCSKSFSTETQLSIHAKIHYKAKPQTCQVCLKNYSSENCLKQHMKEHNSSKMYLCTYCKKLFKSKFYCRKHIRLHRTETVDKDVELEEEKEIFIDFVEKQPIDEINEIAENSQEVCSIPVDLEIPDNPSVLEAVPINSIIEPTDDEQMSESFKATEENIPSDEFETITDPNELKYFLIVDNQIVLISEEQHKQITRDIENSEETNKNQQIILESVEIQPFSAKTISAGSDLTISFDKTLDDSSMEHYLQLTNFNLDNEKITNKSDEFLNEIESFVDNDCPVDEFNLMSTNHKSLLKFINPKPNQQHNDGKTISGDKTIEFILQPIREVDNSETEDNPDNFLTLNADENNGGAPLDTIIEEESNDKTMSKLFQCPHCPKALKKPIDLKRHLRTHTGERPFKCSICDKSFALLCTLKTHNKVHENNKKNEECHVCANKFSSKGSLRIHMRIHSGEKPHKCPYCPQTFRTSGHRKSHLKGHLKQATAKGIHPADTKPKNSKLSHIIEVLNESFNKV